jgi:hypothetical protein
MKGPPVALDVHRDFCEVAMDIVAEGQLRSAGRIDTRADALKLFAQSLDPGDWVALEIHRQRIGDRGDP